MDTTQLYKAVQAIFDTAQSQNRVTKQSRFVFIKSLAAKVNLAPGGPVAAADLYAVANTQGKLSTYRLFYLQHLPELGSNTYRAVVFEHLFASQPPNISEAVYDVNPEAMTFTQKLDAPSITIDGAQLAQTVILPYLQSAQIQEGTTPEQAILEMVTGVTLAT